MADGRRLQKVRHVAVVDRCFELDRIADRAQAGAENDAAPRPPAPAAADVARPIRRFELARCCIGY